MKAVRCVCCGEFVLNTWRYCTACGENQTRGKSNDELLRELEENEA